MRKPLILTKLNRSKQKKDHTSITIFVVMELMIYFAFMYLDIFRNNTSLSTTFKFIGIVLCLLYLLVLYFSAPNLSASNSSTSNISVSKFSLSDLHHCDLFILILALLFTIFSDFFILILDIYLPGLITFCIVQILYMRRLVNWRKFYIKQIHISRVLVRNLFLYGTILIIMLIYKVKLDLLGYVALFYFICITLNTKDAILTAFKIKKGSMILFACGMVLFLLCDINVGIFNLSGYVVIEERIFSNLYQFSTIAMWMFYLPSQVIITLSNNKK